MTEPLMPWLTLIGIGDNGAESLTPEARQALVRASTVVVSGRIADWINLTGKTVINWDDGFGEGLQAILDRAGTPVTVLATGDPMHFGIGSTLLKHVPAGAMIVVPSPSAFSLAAARLGWALQDVDCISLHGRPVELLHRHLAPRARIIALTSDGQSPSAIARELTKAGYGQSRITILEHMGGSAERCETCLVSEIGTRSFADFNSVAIECDDNPQFLPQIPGLPDEAFRHDGQLTKSEIRAITLSKLKPFSGGLLWDVGAGCGSVGIEWMRAARSARAIAIETKPARAEMIRLNALSLGVPSLKIVAGTAPGALDGLEEPDAIFIGGGMTGGGVFDACYSALRVGGIIAANAVTLEGEAELTGLRSRFGGDLIRVAVSRAAPVGRFCGLKSLMPVTIWSMQKAMRQESDGK